MTVHFLYRFETAPLKVHGTKLTFVGSDRRFLNNQRQNFENQVSSFLGWLSEIHRIKISACTGKAGPFALVLAYSKFALRACL